MGAAAEASYQGFSPVDLGVASRRSLPIRRRVVAHGLTLHGPDWRQCVEIGADRRRVRRSEVLTRRAAHAPVDPAGDRQRGPRRAVPGRPQERNLPDSDVGGRGRAGLLPRRLWLPLLHVSVDGGLHAALRLGGELR